MDGMGNGVDGLVDGMIWCRKAWGECGSLREMEDVVGGIRET
jgi:hypothetical protein